MDSPVGLDKPPHVPGPLEGCTQAGGYMQAQERLRELLAIYTSLSKRKAMYTGRKSVKGPKESYLWHSGECMNIGYSSQPTRSSI